MKTLRTLNELAKELDIPGDWLRDEAEAERLPCEPVSGKNIHESWKYLFDVSKVRSRLEDRAELIQTEECGGAFRENVQTGRDASPTDLYKIIYLRQLRDDLSRPLDRSKRAIYFLCSRFPSESRKFIRPIVEAMKHMTDSQREEICRDLRNLGRDVVPELRKMRDEESDENVRRWLLRAIHVVEH